MHTGLLATSSVRRNAAGSRATIASSGVAPNVADRLRERSRAAPTPSASTTTDMYGALQATAGNGAVAGERRVVLRQPPQLVGRLGDEPRLEVVARACRDRVLDESPRTRRSRRHRAPSAEVGGVRSRPNAVDDTSAGRNEMPSSAIALRVVDEPRQLAEVQPVQRRARRDRHVAARAGAAAPRPARPSSAPARRARRGRAASVAASSDTMTREKSRATSSAHRSSSTPLVSRCSDDAPRPEQRGRLEHLRPQQRLAAGEQRPAACPAPAAPRRPASISSSVRSSGAARFPPVARHAAAVAAAGRIEDDERQDERPVRHLAQPHQQRGPIATGGRHRRQCGCSLRRRPPPARLSTGGRTVGSATARREQPRDAAPERWRMRERLRNGRAARAAAGATARQRDRATCAPGTRRAPARAARDRTPARRSRGYIIARSSESTQFCLSPSCALTRS